MYATISSTLGGTYMFKQQPQPRVHVHLLKMWNKETFLLLSLLKAGREEKKGYSKLSCFAVTQPTFKL